MHYWWSSDALEQVSNKRTTKRQLIHTNNGVRMLIIVYFINIVKTRENVTRDRIKKLIFSHEKQDNHKFLKRI